MACDSLVVLRQAGARPKKLRDKAQAYRRGEHARMLIVGCTAYQPSQKRFRIFCGQGRGARRWHGTIVDLRQNTLAFGIHTTVACKIDLAFLTTWTVARCARSTQNGGNVLAVAWCRRRTAGGKRKLTACAVLTGAAAGGE